MRATWWRFHGQIDSVRFLDKYYHPAVPEAIKVLLGGPILQDELLLLWTVRASFYLGIGRGKLRLSLYTRLYGPRT